MPRPTAPRLAALSLAALGIVCAPAGPSAQEDRPHLERVAHHAQRDFEVTRRALLPRVPPRDGGCDIDIGRLCYWDDNDDRPLRPEGPHIARARDRLRASLDSLGTLDPASDFIAGQRVRYAIEAGDTSGAAAIAARCAATPWWCQALRGFVHHRAGDEASSAAAFDSALAAMPDTLRCAWLDVRPWLPPGTHLGAPHRDHDCASRAAAGERVFWLAAPLLTWRRDASRDEFFSRRTLALLLAGTTNPQHLSWGWDVAETSLRYGWPEQWAREDDPFDPRTFPDPPILGEEPKPSFSVVPDRQALDAPFTSRPNDWRLVDHRAAVMRYAPGWLRTLDTMPVQIARFKHGPDSMVVVAAYDGHTLIDSGSAALTTRASLSTGLSADSTLAMSPAAQAAAGALVLAAPAQPALAAVEALDSAGRRAARWRAGIAPLAESAPISDLLVGLAAGPEYRPESPDSAARYALAQLRVTSRDTLALYWEVYLRPPPGASERVSVRLTRSAGLVGRIGRALGLGHGPSGAAVSWADQGADPAPARSLRFAIPKVPSGHYRLEVTVEMGHVHGTAGRDIEVVDSRP